VSGVHLDDLGKATPKVCNGATGEVATDRIVFMHAHLASGVSAQIGIINLFRQSEGDRFSFPATGFAVETCRVNSEQMNLYDHLKSREVDTRLPLVADLSGEMINVSFQSLDATNRTVHFYAPVLADVEYRQAAPVPDYRAELLERLARRPVTPIFSCNCILNYLYADLEHAASLSIGGPATFGEIAYLLLNQTLVYVDLVRHSNREEKPNGTL
jgi:hypothetical protein